MRTFLIFFLLIGVIKQKECVVNDILNFNKYINSLENFCIDYKQHCNEDLIKIAMKYLKDMEIKINNSILEELRKKKRAEKLKQIKSKKVEQKLREHFLDRYFKK